VSVSILFCLIQLLTCSYRLGFAELPTLNSSALQKIHTHPKL
jgi:hypothetical protein